MRSFTSLSRDALMNLYDAIVVAANKKSEAKGIVVVRSSYVGSRIVTHNYNNLDDDYDLISSGILTPEKSRIFLQLCLIKTDDINTIQKLFNEF